MSPAITRCGYQSAPFQCNVYCEDQIYGLKVHYIANAARDDRHPNAGTLDLVRLG